MNMKKFATVVFFALSTTVSAATDTTSKASYEAAKKQAATLYAADRNLCAEENSSGARMQCLRDAKAEYNKSLVTAEESYTKDMAAAVATPASKAAAICAECGKVAAVKVVEEKGESSPLGMIAGGVAGAVLGHQVGGGRGKDIATIAGVAGGAYAGHKIEEHMKTKKSWIVAVHFEDGVDREYSFTADPGYAAGDPVKLFGNSIVRR
ncbi:MAG: glycine zipper 2TM domain-containing protein [Georgfuchsia sp.]